MRQHLLAIIAVLAAAILALFSINTEYSGSRYGYGYGQRNVAGAQFIASNGTDTPDTEEFVIPVVEANNHSPLQEKTIPIEQNEHPSLAETKIFSPLHHTAMTALSPAEVPPLDAGMVNVTANMESKMKNAELENGGETDNNVRATGYRVQSPVNNSEFRIAIPYNPALLPQGFTEDDIQTYVYDRQFHRWMAIERDSVNEVELLVYSRFSRNPLVRTNNMYPSDVETFHETSLQTPTMNIADFMQQTGEGGGDSPLDFINAVLKTPEMPETSAYTPTSIKELKAADPLEGLTLMQPPTANNSGTANLSYPIEIPAGRQGMQPNLALTYSSSGGNGWLGVGWDISIPSITVETRWGVPRYDSDYESEVYVYEGEQLVTFDSVENKFREMPHRTKHWTSRSVLDLDSVEQFYPRKNEVFDSIVRHGNGPSSYWWTVTHKNGVTDYYGKYASDGGVNNNCVLRKTDNNTNSTGPIAHWALAESVDPYGNSVRYYYDIVYNKGVSNGNWGKQIYVDSISYTCLNSTNPTLVESGKYSLVFQRKGTNRTDIITSLNRGMKEVTADVLCHLDVKYRDTLFRQYFFVTKNDKTTKYKTIITDIVRIDSPDVKMNCDNVLEGDELILLENENKLYSARYHLDYFEYPSAGDLYSSPDTVNNLPDDDISLKGVKNTFRSTALGATKTKSWNLGGTGAVGLGPDICTTIATFGANATYSNSKSEGLMTLVDLDGDGLADKVFKKDGKLYFRKRLYSPEVPFAFETTKHQITGGVSDFLKESSNGISLGLQASCVVEVSNGLPAGWSTTTNYMADINGDGLVDIVTDQGAYFGKHIQGQTPSFSSINAIQTTILGSGDTNYSYIPSSSLGTGDCGGIIFDGSIDTNIACVLSSCEKTIPRSDTIPANFLSDGCITQIIGYKNDEYVEPYIVDTIHIQPKKSETHVWPPAVDSMIIRTVCPLKKDCGSIQHAPDFDAVRVWVAPYNDTIKIISSIRLVPDDTALFRQSRYADGVECSIEHNKECHISADGKKLVSDTSHQLLSHEVVSPESNFVDSIHDIVVGKDDILFFRLQSKDNRSFDKVDWRVRIEAKNHTGHDSVYDRNKAIFNSDSDFVLTGKNLFQTPLDGQIWLSGRLKYEDAGAIGRIMLITPDTSVCLYTLNPDTIINTLLSVGPIQVDTPNTITVRIERSGNDNLQWPNIHFTPLLKFFPFNTSIIKDTVYYYPQIQLDIKHNDSGDSFKQLCRKYFGELYRGWGQFAYKRKKSGSTLIELSRLELPTWYTATSLTQEDSSALQFVVDTNDLDNSLSEAVENVHNPLVSVINDSVPVVSWIEMTAYNDMGMYRGTGLNTAVSALFLDNTEPVLNIPVADSVPGSLSYGESDVDLEIIPIYDHPVPVSVSSEPVQTIRKRHWNIGGDKSIGVTAVLLSFGRSSSSGSAYIQSDYMDMNGDRYPDPVSTGGVQYSMPWGGIGDLKTIVLPKKDHLSASESYSQGQTHGRCYPDPRKLPSNNPKSGKTALTGSGTLSESEVINEDITDYMFMDVNGDGLPDIVNTSIKAVRLNTGYDFLNAESWNVDFIREGESRNQSTNMGLSGVWENQNLQSVPANSYSLSQVSISGGRGKGISYNVTAKQMMDVNGDGLPDKVEAISNDIRVRYNLGNGQWSSVDTIHGVNISASRSSSEDVNFGVTAGFTVCAIAKVNFGVQTSPYNRSLATDVAQLVDIDGDGYPDYITSGNESSVTIRFNTAGKTNLLRKVTNFTGSTIEMDYELSIPSYEKPQRSWNLSRVETRNNVDTCPVGGNRTLTTFAYESPNYNRHERMDYGYQRVTTYQYDTEDNDTLYRYTVEEFNNRDFTRRGRKTRDCVYDADSMPYVEHIYGDTLYDYAESIVADGGCARTDVYVKKEVDITNWYEGQSSPQITSMTYREYDRYRNVKEYIHYGDTTRYDEWLKAEIDYAQEMPHNLVSLPVQIVVTNHSGDTMQKRTASYDSTGKLCQLVRCNSGGNAQYDFTYDICGNLSSVLMPRNKTGQRLRFSYQYDNVVHTYPVRVDNDSLGFFSTAEYNLRFGKPTKTTDINGNEMWYEYDNLGRTVKITAPYEQDANAPYTIKMEYHPHHYGETEVGNNNSNPYSYACTYHYDPQHPTDPIRITLITDGLGRLLQTKKDAEIGGQEVSIVTGRTIYDCFGRTLAQYQPFTEDTALYAVYNDSLTAGTATLTAYDMMDRQKQVTQQPYGYVTHLDYGFENWNGRTLFSTETTDPKGNTFTVLKGTLGQQMAQIDPANKATVFYYDALGRLTGSVDPDTISTYYEYDKLGRMVHRTHPDAGDDCYHFDPAGNMVHHVNGNGDTVRYDYYYNLLTNIYYPNNPANNVRYVYGMSGSPANTTGKIVLQEDASGWQTFKYGKLGEVTENIRTFALPNESRPYTFKMKFHYDSWNRIDTMIYPDGEVVSYDYNLGGMLKGIKGNKSGNLRTYVRDIRYNKFELKDSVAYGNGTRARYEYDSLLRLSHLYSWDTSGHALQSISYTYDSVGNITDIVNSAITLPNGLGGNYQSHYTFDQRYRLTGATGNRNNNQLSYNLYMQYRDNGRILRKQLYVGDFASIGTAITNYNNGYSYPTGSSQPNTVTKIYDQASNSRQCFSWDRAGNMVYHLDANGCDRRMCWDEENRLMSFSGCDNTGFYQYDAGGERTYKLTSRMVMQNLLGQWNAYQALNNPTLYASPYLVATEKGYTKHYYAESERIASRIGNGIDSVDCFICNIEDYQGSPLTIKAPVWGGEYPREHFGDKQVGNRRHLNKALVCAGANPSITQECLIVLYKYDIVPHHELEPECYWYHPDHLGSSSWVTDVNGHAVQHLEYLPWGEDFVDQRANSFNGVRYTFSAKEKDSETGLSYFGSRYYSSDLSIWLSVDPMSDKYPSLSPYVYCADNPVKLVDPNGEEYRNPPWILLKGIARVVEATSKNADVKTVAYSFNHPINAIRVGTAKDGGKNISSVASNFAINMSKAADLSSAGEGSQRNAIRHVLWQAMLTNIFGSKQAERIGNIHENGPKADLSQRSFMTMGEADKVVDQLNNEIGRSIGERNKGADNVTLAKQVADEFYNNGFWTVSENSDNTFSIHKSKISKAEYNKMINDINKMNNNGLHD